jgi:hypothetical protein
VTQANYKNKQTVLSFAFETAWIQHVQKKSQTIKRWMCLNRSQILFVAYSAFKSFNSFMNPTDLSGVLPYAETTGIP